MFAALKLRFNNWLFRPKIEEGPITLTQRRIFILPTRQGLAFAGVLLMMLLGDINYNLSLGYILTFLLATMAISSMLHAFRNLAYLEISAGYAEPVFQGEMARFPLHIHSKIARYQLILNDEKETRFDLPANQTTEIHGLRRAEKRGFLESGKITIYTEFPLGLFRAWSYLHFDARCLVYPKPMANAKLAEQTSAVAHGDDDFSGLRTYVPGDAKPRIAWKAYARDRGLLVKQFSGSDDELWLDMEDAEDASVEDRLSRMTAWVHEAESKGLRYGLRLTDDEIKPGHGTAHRESCLAMLALFGIHK